MERLSFGNLGDEDREAASHNESREAQSVETGFDKRIELEEGLNNELLSIYKTKLDSILQEKGIKDLIT